MGVTALGLRCRSALLLFIVVLICTITQHRGYNLPYTAKHHVYHRPVHTKRHSERGSTARHLTAPSSDPIEEGLRLGISIESAGFLRNIVEYGDNRMARRAVGVLQKMPAYRQIPTEVHFTAALWACAKGMLESDMHV